MSINHYVAFNIIETSRSSVKAKHHLEIPNVQLHLFDVSLLFRKLSYASCNSIDLYNTQIIIHINSTIPYICIKTYANVNFLYTLVQPRNSLSNHLRVTMCNIQKTSLWFVLNSFKYTLSQIQYNGLNLFNPSKYHTILIQY